MDTKIRVLLTAAEKNGVPKGSSSLQAAYSLMKDVAQTRISVDNPDAFSQDLFVLAAEISLAHGESSMARECLQMYFMRTPPTNQFLCRAYLCQAQLMAPTDASSTDKMEKAVLYLVKAVSIAKDNPRYHFLVYNASVLYWHFCRPFLKPKYRQYLARSLHQIVKALDDIDDNDYEWRAQLMIALIECHLDSGRRQDASHIAIAAAGFIKQHVPAMYKTVFGLMVRHQLCEPSKLTKEIRQSVELSIFNRISKLKTTIEQKDGDIGDEMRSIAATLASKPEDPGKSLAAKGRRSTTPEDRKSPTRQSRRTPTPTGAKGALDAHDKPYLLLELMRLALEHDVTDCAQHCAQLIKENSDLVKDSSFWVEVEFAQSDLMVKCLQNKQQSYKSAIVDIRIQAIKRCSEALQNAVRLNNPNVMQAGCVTQWNLCLPLLQTNLRSRVRRPLTQVADILENIDSLLNELRCQVHTELAKCEEDIEQIELAMGHLKKAQSLDDGHVYQKRLEVALHRLELRAELYKQPERDEDQAAMIIEQARKADSGTLRMKRSLLVRAGLALAPDAFMLVLDSENETKEFTVSKGPVTAISRLAARASQFKKSIRKAEGHLRRLGDECDRERAQLWADLARTARKQEVWDVCRVACRFCLLYDDNRWKIVPPAPTKTPQKKRSELRDSMQNLDTPDGEMSRGGTKLTLATSRSGGADTSRPITPEPTDILYERDLIRMLAQVYFINGESLIHLLRCEGVELGDKPIPPTDKSKRPKGYVSKKPEEDEDWIEYVEWLDSLTSDTITSFLRAATLGVDLIEPWIVCSSASYVWNYYKHVFDADRHREIIDTLQALVDAMRKIGHSSEITLYTSVSTALSRGLIAPWLPHAAIPETVAATPLPGAGGRVSSAKKKIGGGGAPNASKSKMSPTFTVNPDAIPDCKRAIEICEYAMRLTNGDNPLDVVSVAVRHQLLRVWVLAKQLLQAQVGKNLGADEDSSAKAIAVMTKAIVAVEMISINSNGVMEFKDTPTIAAAIELLEACTCADPTVELELWTILAYQAWLTAQHPDLVICTGKALALADHVTYLKNKKSDAHRFKISQELLSYASSLYGQSLMVTGGKSKNMVRRQAMQQFIHSASFARNAGNNLLVITAARHYWNCILPLIAQPIEREILQRPLTTLLQAISATTDKSIYKKAEDKLKRAALEYDTAVEEFDAEEEELSGGGKAAFSGDTAGGDDPSAGKEVEKRPSAAVGGPDDDLTLRASLYGVLFQSYADKGEWEAGLSAMDQAIADMPRTNHRLLIFKHLVMVKAHLGMNVEGSIMRFQDESEDSMAHMWRRVALCSTNILEQLQAYQKAIDVLVSPSSEWQKVEYLIELSQWLYCNEYPLQDVLDQLEWATDILLQMKFQKEAKKDGAAKGKKSRGGKKGKTPPASAKTPKGGKKGKQSDDKATPKGQKGQKEEEPQKELTVKEAKKEDSFVPVEREVIIGVPAPASPVSLSSMSDIKQLEALVRINIIMAQVSGRGSQYYQDYCILAYSYVQRIWQVSMSKCGPVIKEIAKNPPSSADTGKNTPKGGKGKKDAKEVVKERPKRKGPLDILPLSSEEWGNYDAPDEVVDAFKHPQMRSTGVNVHTITKPNMTMHYLFTLVDQLRDIGCNHLTLSVLALCDVLSRGVVKSRPLTAFIHLRSMEVCYELNLLQGVAFHEKYADIKINEEEQAQSRQDIALWKEHKIQVEKEERRIKSTLDDVPAQKTPHSPRKKQKNEKETKKDPVAPHLGRKIGGVQLCDIWTDTADVLMRLSMYQPCREMLHEAHLAAKSFTDSRLCSHVLYLLAYLSYNEAQYGQAVKLCHKAQTAHQGDEMFFYNTTILMADACMADYTLRNRFRRARGFLANAIPVFQAVADVRPNKLSLTGYILAMLEAKLGIIQSRITLDECTDFTKPKVVDNVMSACKKLRHGTQQLVTLGYERESTQFYKEHAELLIHLAKHTFDKEEKHNLYLQALTVYQESCAVMTEVVRDVESITPLSELRHCNLPVQRELLSTQLECARLMLDIWEESLDDVLEKQQQNNRKDSIMKAVAELIDEVPDYTETGRVWMETTRLIPQTLLSQLTTCHAQASEILPLRCQSLFLLGRALRLTAVRENPDSSKQWETEELDPELPQSSAITTVTEDALEQSLGQTPLEGQQVVDTNSHKYIKHSKRMIERKLSLEKSHQFYVEATECLMQANHLAVKEGLTELAGLAALELAECTGQYDPGLTSHYLALYQSCASAQYMSSLLSKALVDPRTSRQAALLHQKHHLMKNNITSNMSASSTATAINAELKKESIACQRLEILPNHMELMKEFPPTFNMVVLQHSPDGKYLYGAIMDKPKPQAGGAGDGKKEKKGVSVQAPSSAKVVRVKTIYGQLARLQERFYEYKQEIMQILLKAEYQRSQKAQREKMLANLDESLKNKSQNISEEDEELKLEEMRLHEEFVQILDELEDYVRPIMIQLDQHNRSSSSMSTTDKPVRGGGDPPPPQEYLVILADPELLKLPLEALNALQADKFISLSRDVSLQMLYHRTHIEPLDDAEERARREREKNKPPSRIPGLRDASKKMSKIIPLDRPVPANCLPVDTHAFRFVVDPHLDCSETERHAPLDIFKKMLDEHEQQFTPRWLGVAGDDHMPSPGEYEIYMNEGSAFVFYGMERFLTYLPPYKMAALNLPECQLVVLLDHMQTNQSFFRQSKIDVLKTGEVVSLENAVNSALLVSLTGVRSILMNQWECTLQENAHRIDILMKDLLAGGITTGQCARYLFTPYRRVKNDPATEQAEAADGNQGNRDSGNQGDGADDGEPEDAVQSTVPPGQLMSMEMNRSWYNMVCYGVPNLMVTQLSKP